MLFLFLVIVVTLCLNLFFICHIVFLSIFDFISLITRVFVPNFGVGNIPMDNTVARVTNGNKIAERIIIMVAVSMVYREFSTRLLEEITKRYVATGAFIAISFKSFVFKVVKMSSVMPIFVITRATQSKAFMGFNFLAVLAFSRFRTSLYDRISQPVVVLAHNIYSSNKIEVLQPLL